MADFQEMQRRFTQAIRHPGHSPESEFDQERVQLYRELLFNNILGFLENGFPRLRHALPAEAWHERVSAFFSRHYCQSPYFKDIAGEFAGFVRQHPDSDYPWLAELAHFEWAELAAEVAEGSLPPFVPGNILGQPVVVSPWVWPLVYQWPFHDSRLTAPSEANRKSVALLLYRNARHEVFWLETTLVAASVLELLQKEALTLSQATHRIADAHGLDVLTLEPHIQEQTRLWLERGMILGVAPENG